ncbi:MerR family DNA-binding protein [Alphaproteobacteria bacterium]|nr:MerR family DNA-binding protein [Alphaproteobacteria bacterium]
MNISAAPRQSGVPRNAIRNYESVGVIPEVARTSSGYRAHTQSNIDTLRFVQNARGLGFSVRHVGALLGLWHDRAWASADVKELVSVHVEEIDQKIIELQDMRNTLVHLTDCCHGDDRPGCSVLEEVVGCA